MTATPYVDASRCSSDGKNKCAARQAYSFKATGVRAPSRGSAALRLSTRTRHDGPARPGRASVPEGRRSSSGGVRPVSCPGSVFVIGAAGTLVSFTLPEHLDAAHVDFARQLAAKAWAYAVAVNAVTGACRRCRTCRFRTR
jgi:hypothetical protein